MNQSTFTRFTAGCLVWQTVAAALVGLNAGVFSEAWTNWNLALFGFQALLLACCFFNVHVAVWLIGSVGRAWPTFDAFKKFLS